MSEKKLQPTHYALRTTHYEKGFSLAEVLMSLGILSIGMLLIAAIFPAGVYFATISTERTIAAVVADEAFAKIKIYGNDPNVDFEPLTDLGVECSIFPSSNLMLAQWSEDEFLYPSDPDPDLDKFYCWSAIWRRLPTDPTGENVQVTVFVSRKAGAAALYYHLNPSTNEFDETNPFPAPVLVEISVGAGNRITITENVRCSLEEARTFLTEGCTIVDGLTGFLYRVLRRDDANPDVVYLDKDFFDLDSDGKSDVWVVPHPVGGGRPPCIAVYQKVIRF
jgi:prepilin-type N-terminal cleavage/methylation domain-containing protein